MVVEFGSALAGIVLDTVNPALTAQDFAYLLRQSQSFGIVVQPAFRDRDMLAVIGGIRHELPRLRELLIVDTLCQEAPPDVPLPEVPPDQIVQIQYMSWTTGCAKGRC